MHFFASYHWVLEGAPQLMFGIHAPCSDGINQPVFAIHFGPFILTYWRQPPF